MDRSVRQSVDPVRRGVHGPGVSVFGSPSSDGTIDSLMPYSPAISELFSTASASATILSLKARL